MSKDCLREKYANANAVTQHGLESNRLQLLQNCLALKRPIPSLRAHGLSALTEDQARPLIQEVETKATLQAIESKLRQIRILEKQIATIRKNHPDSPELVKDGKLLFVQQKKLAKKIEFLRKCDDTKFSSWKKKKKVVSVTVDQYNKKISAKKLKKKIKARARKDRKKEREIKERARVAIEKNLVVNLTDIDVPLYSVAIMSYGPGWIPCPTFDETQFKIDGYNAANKQCWKAKFKGSQKTNDLPMDLLKKPLTTPCTSIEDSALKSMKDNIVNFVDNFKPKKLQSNMNRFEREGYAWLKRAVSEGTIAVTSADKGGAVIIVTPELIKEITASKVGDPLRYRPLPSDPTALLRKRLLKVWTTGLEKEFVSSEQSRGVVGLLQNDESGALTQSTSDNIKPDIPYGYPLLKIHKLSEAELLQKKIPPSRFVTDLSRGVTARSDKFLVWKYLGPLSRDYCIDLVKDSTAALMKLEDLGASGEVDDSWFSISIDIVSLYDSLRHELVMEALDDAMISCRPDWPLDLRCWIKSLVQLSFDSAVLKNDDQWYEVVNGVPTGGINSVDCGNMALFFVLKNLVYNNRPEELKNIDRFVDDISGQGKGSITKFTEWVELLRTQMVSTYGLDITYDVKPITQPTQFLDIQYQFEAGKLTTDLFRKPTDANRYLEFSSFHPRHTFRSIVFSQALRYRRIVNDEDLLDKRLTELQAFFEQSSYPSDMVKEVIREVRSRPRSLGYRTTNRDPTVFTPWIITYGAGYTETKEKVTEVNDIISNSRTWINEAPPQIPKFQVVTRRAPSLKDTLFKRKKLALGSDSSSTDPCTKPGEKKKGRPCMTCKLVSGTSCVTNNSNTVRTQGGDCKSRNIVYAATCKLCTVNNVYVGKTVSTLSQRVNGHRSKFYDILGLYSSNSNFSPYGPGDCDDENVLGAHLFTVHNKREKSDFNDNIMFDILCSTSPDNIRKSEQFYIDKLKSLYPFGLNNIKSISGS